MAMQTTVERVDGAVPVTVMALSGELDASNYLRLVDDVRAALRGRRPPPAARPHRPDVHLELRPGRRCTRSCKVMQGEEPPDPEYGWSALHEMERDVEEGATQNVVRLGGIQPAVAEVLQRTGLDALFPSHPDRESAHRRLLPPPSARPDERRGHRRDCVRGLLRPFAASAMSSPSASSPRVSRPRRPRPTRRASTGRA